MSCSRCPLVLFSLLGVWLSAGVVCGQLRIHEWVSANDGSWRDADGDASDWIEVHNPGRESVSLDGWTLSDDAEALDKWSFPLHSLEPGGFLVVVASGKDRVEGDQWHTNFKLDRDGEFLGLTNPAGVMVSGWEPTFPAVPSGQSYGWDDEQGNYRFWRSPSPGAPNRDDPTLGPWLTQPRFATAEAEEGIDFVVSIQVASHGAPLEWVRMKYRVMYKTEAVALLLDNGVSPDAVAGDGRFSGAIPAKTLFGNRFRAGEMLRWAFEATDEVGHASRLPSVDEGIVAQPEYFGTVVASPDVTTPLPILHWFTDAPERAERPGGSRASAYFDGQFYDNLFVRRRGQFGAIDWSKPKLKFDFNPGNHFLYDPERRRVEEFNLQSHFRDASFMRENLAFGFFNHIGTPASDTRHWHVRLNGTFYGLFSYVEQVDEDFLRQQGLDPEGALYKANGFPSTLAAQVTEALYQKETRKDEPYDDLIAFAQGINGSDRFHYIMDHVNLPAMVNEMAGQTTIRNADRLTKNYYMYRDPETDLWQRFPWDMDGAFSMGSMSENFASPLYGDSEHTQAPGQPIYQNFLLDAILDHRRTREMYLRRLRTLIDTYLTEAPNYFWEEIDRRHDLIRDDALEDAQAWSTGNIDAGVRALKGNAFALRRRELLETFGKDLVPPAQTPGLLLEVGEVDPAPGEVRQEYFQLINPNAEAVDLSGWRLRGAVNWTFPAGTVIPSKGTLFDPDRGVLYVVKDVRGFRGRPEGPGGEQGLFYVGGYQGRLSAAGETIVLEDAAGRQVVSHAYEGIAGTSYADWAAAEFEPAALEDVRVSGWDADPFGLGVSNLHRYAFGSEAEWARVAAETLRYRRVSGSSDLEFVLEASSDLIDWRPLDPGSFEETLEPVFEEEGYERVTVRWLDVSSSGPYYRLKARLLSAE